MRKCESGRGERVSVKESKRRHCRRSILLLGGRLCGLWYSIQFRLTVSSLTQLKGDSAPSFLPAFWVSGLPACLLARVLLGFPRARQKFRVASFSRLLFTTTELVLHSVSIASGLYSPVDQI
jgi:hypothetical protein